MGSAISSILTQAIGAAINSGAGAGGERTTTAAFYWNEDDLQCGDGAVGGARLL